MKVLQKQRKNWNKQNIILKKPERNLLKRMKNEEPRINSLVQPQQSSGLGALDHEAIVQNISTSVTQKKGSYQQHIKTNKLLAYSYY